MKIQTLSVVVPTKKCVNNCPFCVSKLHSHNVSTSYEALYETIADFLEWWNEN